MDALETREGLGGAFTDEQTDALIEVLRHVVTRKELEDELEKFELRLKREMGRWALRIVSVNLAGMAALLALYAFAS